MDMDAVALSSIITAAAAAVSTIAGILISSKLSAYRIEQLEKKVEKHNNLIERMFKVEKKDELFDLEMNNLKDKMKDLERKVNHYHES